MVKIFDFHPFRKLKLYEEQELTMQVFSEPEFCSTSDPSPVNQIYSYIMQLRPNAIVSLFQTTLDRRDSFGTSHAGDNTYATIQPRNGSQIADVADYATLRNNRVPSVRSCTFPLSFLRIFIIYVLYFYISPDVWIHWFDIPSASPGTRWFRHWVDIS